MKKVVVRSLDGGVEAGFAAREKIGPRFEILDREGKPKAFEMAKVKAIFFVKDFEGDPEYQDIRFLTRKRGSEAVWVRATFSDGEVLEGRVENNLQLVCAPGFYMWPSDADTNNDCAYVSKDALVDFSILGAD